MQKTLNGKIIINIFVKMLIFDRKEIGNAKSEIELAWNKKGIDRQKNRSGRTWRKDKEESRWNLKIIKVFSI